MEFSHYDPVPRSVADEVIEQASKPKTAVAS
jgi:translation elongation factor EF-G